LRFGLKIARLTDEQKLLKLLAHPLDRWQEVVQKEDVRVDKTSKWVLCNRVDSLKSAIEERRSALVADQPGSMLDPSFPGSAFAALLVTYQDDLYVVSEGAPAPNRVLLDLRNTTEKWLGHGEQRKHVARLPHPSEACCYRIAHGR
jgi:hypothetical protein